MQYGLLKNILLPIVTLWAGWLFAILQPEVQTATGAYPEQLPGPFTGGFGEKSCHDCHFDYPVNDNPGWIEIEGVPDRYRPDSTYRFIVRTGRPDLQKAGFQLSSRFAGSGEQAGQLNSETNRTAFTHVETVSTSYLQHSEAGAEPNDSLSAAWRISWSAPVQPADTVVIHVAVNAGNGDASAFGDYINTREIVILPPD